MQFAPAIQSLSERCADDPWSLTLDERQTLLKAAQDAQHEWCVRLPMLVEPPAPTADFPAFLLTMPRFAGLREAIGGAGTRRDLSTDVADRLQHFVDLYRLWLTVIDPAGSDLRVPRAS